MCKMAAEETKLKNIPAFIEQNNKNKTKENKQKKRLAHIILPILFA